MTDSSQRPTKRPTRRTRRDGSTEPSRGTRRTRVGTRGDGHGRSRRSHTSARAGHVSPGEAPAQAATGAQAEAAGRRKGFSLPRPSLPNVQLPRWLSATLVVVAFLVVAVAMLYSPACQLWAAWRANEALASEYEELAEENAELTSETERLQTLEGIEDEAREIGYVYEGETGVIVEGLDTAEDDEAEDEAEEDPWYVRLGDVVFGYEG